MASPFQREFFIRIAEQAAADATRDDAALRAPYAGNVVAVTYTPDKATTGDNTNSRTLSIINKGQSGVGSTSVASLALVTGVDLVAYDEKAITVSGTAANVAVVTGDILAFESAKVASGVLVGAGLLKIVIASTV